VTMRVVVGVVGVVWRAWASGARTVSGVRWLTSLLCDAETMRRRGNSRPGNPVQ
jgi:hypothetical protein